MTQCKHGSLLFNCAKCQEDDEVERLRSLVKSAYIEGHNHGRAKGTITYHSSEDWERSRSRAALKEQE